MTMSCDHESWPRIVTTSRDHESWRYMLIGESPDGWNFLPKYQNFDGGTVLMSFGIFYGHSLDYIELMFPAIIRWSHASSFSSCLLSFPFLNSNLCILLMRSYSIYYNWSNLSIFVGFEKRYSASCLPGLKIYILSSTFCGLFGSGTNCFDKTSPKIPVLRYFNGVHP